MAKRFGFEIKRSKEEKLIDELPSFAAPSNDDGAAIVASGGAYGYYVDIDGNIKSEADLISKYREMSLIGEIDLAIDDIVNEAIVCQEGDASIELLLDKVELSDNLKEIIKYEFENILDLLEFRYKAYEIFRRYYIDGRLYYHCMVNDEKLKDGIKELRYIDPRKIKKIKEIKKQSKQDQASDTLMNKVAEYYIYSEKGFSGKNSATASYDQGSISGLKIAKDSILHITSGLTDSTGSMVLGHMHKAIRPLNQLRNLEDATIIYRISRSPERRIFYIDVGNLPKIKAEQYLNEMMKKHKNKLVYNAETGEVQDSRRFQTLMEDYWLPRREGGRGTEISTLPSAQNLGEMEDVNYFLKKLYKALNVPVTRLEPEMSYNLGRATEISRDEIKFGLFIDRLRLKFTELFTKCLEKQLILKEILTPEETKNILKKISFRFKTNNYFKELKESEILSDRLARLQQVSPYVGRYYSNKEIRKVILKQNDEDMMRNDQDIMQEKENPLYQLPLDSGVFNMIQQEKQFELQQENSQQEEENSQKEQKNKNWQFEEFHDINNFEDLNEDNIIILPERKENV